MKDKHPAKLKLARSLMTQDEIKAKVSPFNSKAWNERKEEIKKRVLEDQRRKK
jgi:hypothetical protein